MQTDLVEDKVFEKQDFTTERLPAVHYEYCTFKNCNFSEGYLSNTRFLECDFIDCNLSSTNISGSTFQDVTFEGCKLLGLHFETSNPFGFAVQFKNCQLNHSSFYQMDLKYVQFSNSKLITADFTESDLSNSCLDGCDLQGAIFENTNLEKADFRKTTNYAIHPEKNSIKGAKFSLDGVAGLLAVYGVEIENP